MFLANMVFFILLLLPSLWFLLVMAKPPRLRILASQTPNYYYVLKRDCNHYFWDYFFWIYSFCCCFCYHCIWGQRYRCTNSAPNQSLCVHCDNSSYDILLLRLVYVLFLLSFSCDHFATFSCRVCFVVHTFENQQQNNTWLGQPCYGFVGLWGMAARGVLVAGPSGGLRGRWALEQLRIGGLWRLPKVHAAIAQRCAIFQQIWMLIKLVIAQNSEEG